ncbi:MAG TPA: hypothetical protein VH643_38145 [Gemmataceae bacterium]|jgi:hypothetical protein
MDSVREIIALFGGMAKLQELAIRVESPGFMPLAIEYVGVGPRGGALVGVAHHYLQNGDLMCDPEVVFEVFGDDWQPVTYQQDNIGLYQEAVFLDGDKVMLRPKLTKDLQAFMQLWDKNLTDQGFVEAARRTCSDKSGG